MEKYSSPSDTDSPSWLEEKRKALDKLNYSALRVAENYNLMKTVIVDNTFCSYVNFKRRMKTLRRFLEEANRLEHLMQGMDEYNQKPSFGGFLSDEYVKVLAENIGDNTGQIAAFVWDNNWGATGEISTIKKLYKAIVYA